MTWARIDRYRLKTGKTLASVAEDLGIGVSMLMMVKTGRRDISRKVAFRLAEVERAAGLDPPLPDVGRPSGGDVRGLEKHRENAAGNTGGASVSGASGVKSFPGGMAREEAASYDAGPRAAARERRSGLLRRLRAVETELAEIRKALEEDGA